MNKIINTTTTGPAAMSSIEIAELCDKRHDNVMRDVKTMLEALDLDLLKFEGIYRDGRSREQKCYNLPRDLTMTLVTGYSIPLRKKVIDRLDELEKRGAPVTAADLLANPQQLLAITQGYALQIEDMKREITSMQVDVDALDRIAGADELFGVRVAAKLLKMPEKKFVEWLRANKWAYRQTGTMALLCYADKDRSGLCRNVAASYEKQDGTTAVRETFKITAAGLVKLAKIFNVELPHGDLFARQGEAA